MMRIFKMAVLLVMVSIATSFGQAPNKIQGKTAAEWIETLKTHKEVRFRRAALIVLEVYGPRTEGVLPALTGALEADADAQVRREAAMLLGRIGEEAKGSIYALGDALKKDPSELVREAAALALGSKTLNKHAAEQLRALSDALSDTHAGTRAAAAEAILKLGEKAAPAIPALIALVKDGSKDRFSRQFALKCLGRLAEDDRDIAQIFIDILGDRAAPLGVRQEAADALGRSTVAAEIVIPPLAELLDDAAPEIRRAAAASLARQGKDSEIAWPKIEAALKGQDALVRYQLIRLSGALGKSQGEAINALIDRAKTDSNIENRLAAIQELSAYPSNPVEMALQLIAENDTNAAIRSAAEAALKKIALP
jgi:HEAT repeat protein